MNNVKAPYNVNKLTSEVANNAMRNISTLQKNIAVLLEEREKVRVGLEDMEFVVKVFPSDSNFLLVRMKMLSKEVYTAMADAGIVVRYRGSELHCEECLRITIGTEEENKACLVMLVKIYNELSAAK